LWHFVSGVASSVKNADGREVDFGAVHLDTQARGADRSTVSSLTMMEYHIPISGYFSPPCGTLDVGISNLSPATRNDEGASLASAFRRPRMTNPHLGPRRLRVVGRSYRLSVSFLAHSN
jgi:hypothetical protein